MCTGDNCDCMDDSCCTLRTKSIFLSLWNMCFGLYICVHQGWSGARANMHDVNRLPRFLQKLVEITVGLLFAYAALGLINTIAGLLMLIAIAKRIRALFLVTIIFTFFLPIFVIFLVVPFVIQIIFGIMAIRFWSKKMRE